MFLLPHCQAPMVSDFLASFSFSCCPFLLHVCPPLAFSPQQLQNKIQQLKSYVEQAYGFTLPLTIFIISTANLRHPRPVGSWAAAFSGLLLQVPEVLSFSPEEMDTSNN